MEISHKKVIIATYCSLGARVGRYFKHQFAYDCICAQSSDKAAVMELHFQYEQEIINFVSDAIDEKIAREPKPASRWNEED